MATVRVEGGELHVEGGDRMSPERRRDLELAALAMLGECRGLEPGQMPATAERSQSKPTKLGPLPRSKHEPSQLRRSSEWRQQGVSDEVLALYSRSTPGRSIN